MKGISWNLTQDNFTAKYYANSVFDKFSRPST
jgi:hypothetical protein